MGIREDILAEATRQLAAKGYGGTSLNGIAEAVGIRKASLLYHFSTKEELRQQVLLTLLSRWREQIPRLLMAASGQRQFEALTSELIGFFRADEDRARILVREALDRPAEMRALIEAHVTPWVCTICDHIRKGQGAGRIFPELDPEAYVMAVINLVVASLATYDCLGVMLGERCATGSESKRGDGRSRQIEAVERMARASLFTEQFRRSGDREKPEES